MSILRVKRSSTVRTGNFNKQEAAESIMMAEHMNGMVQSANLPETIADVNKTALLGGKLVERACGVDEGNGKEHEPQSGIQEMKLFCKEQCQCNGNAMDNIPVTHGVPLEGEWTWCASGEARDPKGSTNALNVTPECVNSSSKLEVTEDTKGVKLESCKRGTNGLASVDEAEMADAGAGFEVEPVNNPNELEMLITMLIQSEGPDGGDIPRICLQGMCWRVGDASGPGCRTDESSGKADISQGLTSVPKSSCNRWEKPATEPDHNRFGLNCSCQS